MKNDYDGLDVIDFEKIREKEARDAYYARANDENVLINIANKNGDKARKEYLRRENIKRQQRKKKIRKKKLIKIGIGVAIATGLTAAAINGLSSCASQFDTEKITDSRSR